MNTLEIRTIDPLGTVCVPKQFRTKLGWDSGLRLTSLVSELKATISLAPHPQGELEIDPLGRVKLTKASRAILGWNEQDEIKMSVKNGALLMWQFEEPA
ncbi:MAG: hypothetical protein FWE05_07450 [Defluviitaleaceae bacterium]|nr:hypothetical protein [Defluviitaleaceae bacterium]